MKKIHKPIPIYSNEPIEIQAVMFSSSITNHKVEIRMEPKYFESQTREPIYGIFKNLLGVTKKCQIIYENPWHSIQYGFTHDIYHGFLTVDSYSEFEKLKTQLKTYDDYVKMCELDKKQKLLKIQENVEKINSIQTVWK